MFYSDTFLLHLQESKMYIVRFLAPRTTCKYWLNAGQASSTLTHHSANIGTESPAALAELAENTAGRQTDIIEPRSPFTKLFRQTVRFLIAPLDKLIGSARYLEIWLINETLRLFPRVVACGWSRVCTPRRVWIDGRARGP